MSATTQDQILDTEAVTETLKTQPPKWLLKFFEELTYGDHSAKVRAIKSSPFFPLLDKRSRDIIGGTRRNKQAKLIEHVHFFLLNISAAWLGLEPIDEDEPTWEQRKVLYKGIRSGLRKLVPDEPRPAQREPSNKDARRDDSKLESKPGARRRHRAREIDLVQAELAASSDKPRRGNRRR